MVKPENPSSPQDSFGGMSDIENTTPDNQNIKFENPNLSSFVPKLENPSPSQTFSPKFEPSLSQTFENLSLGGRKIVKSEQKDQSEYLSTIENLNSKINQQQYEREQENIQFANILSEKDNQLREVELSRHQILNERQNLEQISFEAHKHIESQAAHTHETVQKAVQLEDHLNTVLQDKNRLEQENSQLLERMRQASELESAHNKLRDFSSQQQQNLEILQSRLQDADCQLERARNLEKSASDQSNELQLLRTQLASKSQELESARLHSSELQELKIRLQEAKIKADSQNFSASEVERLNKMMSEWNQKNEECLKKIYDRTSDVRRVEQGIERLLGLSKIFENPNFQNLNPSPQSNLHQLQILERSMQNLTHSLSSTLDNTLPKLWDFHGYRDQKVSLWIDHLKRVAATRNWSELTTFERGVGCLKGKAAEIYFAEEYTITQSIDGLSKFLNEHFGIKNPFNHWVNRLTNYKQNFGQSITDFNHHFREIINNLNKISPNTFNDEYLVLVYCNSLHIDFRLEISRRQKCTTLSAAMQTAVRVEKTVRLVRRGSTDQGDKFRPDQSNFIKTHPNRRDYQNNQAGGVQKSGFQRGRGNRGRNRSSNRYNNFDGRLKEPPTTPYRRLCFRCGRDNHIQSQCRAFTHKNGERLEKPVGVREQGQISGGGDRSSISVSANLRSRGSSSRGYNKMQPRQNIRSNIVNENTENIIFEDSSDEKLDS